MLSNQFKLVVDSVVSSSISLDNTSKELFTLVHSEFLKVSSEHLKGAKADISKYLKDTIVSDSVRQGVQRVVNVAYKYSEMRVITHLDTLTYDNIKGAITLLSYIAKEYDDTIMKSIKSKLSRVKGKETHEYNNKFRAKLIELKNEYKIVVTEDNEVIKLSGVQVMNVVANNIEALSNDERAKLIALLGA